MIASWTASTKFFFVCHSVVAPYCQDLATRHQNKKGTSSLKDEGIPVYLKAAGHFEAFDVTHQPDIVQGLSGV